jgi:hypothetical protein
MPNPKRDSYHADLLKLLNSTLQGGDAHPLEQYLTERAKLSPTYANLPMAHTFADLIGDVVAAGKHDVAVEMLLDGWSNLSIEAAPVGSDREFLPVAAVLAYGQVAVSRREWWQDEVAKLRHAAADGRWRVREMVAAAFQRMLDANWDRAYTDLTDWLNDKNPLVIRAAVAAVAEPPILKAIHRAENALALQWLAIDWFVELPAARRRDEDVRVLRQGLGYTISVAVAAIPDEGFALLEKLAAMKDDKDIQWILRENLKKNRLSKWPEKLDLLRGAVHE